MTTVRRINLSKVEGDNANNTNTNEIRPYGEIALYEGDYDNNIDRDRLELLIFNGARTNLQSKVLSPGIFYGSNADSADGAGLDTIKLIPDATLYRDIGSDQYIVVDPTAPNHIHIRAGGPIDNSSAQLFLGGETTHVSIGSGSTPPVYIKANDYQWTYGTDGNLTLPAGGDIRDSDGNSVLNDTATGIVNPIPAEVRVGTNGYEVEFVGFISNGFGDSSGATLTVTEIISGTIIDGMTIYGAGLPPGGWVLTFGGVLEPQGSGGTGNYLLSGANFFTGSQSFNNNVLVNTEVWTFGLDGGLTFPNDALIAADESNLEIRGLANFNVEASGVVNVYTDVEGTGYQWQFGDDGSLTFPDTTVQTTAYTPTTGSWTVTPGTANYSFTVDWNATYLMWVRANIPNGIIVWNATVTVTNANVPVVGQQFAWNYTGGGSPLAFTAIPSQIIGTAGIISTDTSSPTDSNTFVFGISNTTGSNQTVSYGYIKL